MKLFAFLMEPANYTLETVANVYKPLGVEYCFIKADSRASDKKVVAISEWGFIRRLCYICETIRKYDAFVTNSYSDKNGLLILLVNLLCFRKPMAIESDTELHVPASALKRVVKGMWLSWLFTRKCIYGFPGGYHEHVRLFTHYGMPQDHVFVMPMVVNNALYDRNEPIAPEDGFKFVYVGRLIPLKQVDKIIEAYGKLVQDGLPVELHIIGDGSEVESLKGRGKDLPGLVFHGPLFGKAKIAALHQMHCLVLYSNFEQWGLVVNEALASGVPCIVSDRAGCRNDLICGDKPTGMVVPWDDVDALADAMRDMASSSSAWREYSRRAVERMSHWSYREYTASLRDFMETAMKGDK